MAIVQWFDESDSESVCSRKRKGNSERKRGKCKGHRKQQCVLGNDPIQFFRRRREQITMWIVNCEMYWRSSPGSTKRRKLLDMYISGGRAAIEQRAMADCRCIFGNIICWNRRRARMTVAAAAHFVQNDVRKFNDVQIQQLARVHVVHVHAIQTACACWCMCGLIGTVSFCAAQVNECLFFSLLFLFTSSQCVAGMAYAFRKRAAHLRHDNAQM